LTIKQKRARQKFLKNRREITGPHEQAEGVASEAQDVSPLFKDMTSSDSGVLGFRTPMTNISPRSEKSSDGDDEQQHEGGSKIQYNRNKKNTKRSTNRSTKRMTKRMTKRNTKKKNM
jgi:hypothetical protein